jgi:3-oxoacyl-[acyl-carrier protein] reductase
MNFSNRVAIVTGAGTGIGKSCAEQFAKHGASVVVNYSKSKDAADAVVAGITAAGGTAIALQADVADEDQVKALVAKTVEHFGGIDYLINNAGWSTRIPHHELDKLTDEVWDKTLDTNLRGTFYCVRACVPHLKKRPGAGIVNIASVAGFAGMGSSMVYAASKGAMLTMTKSMARALAPEIRVNAVAPGFVRTAFAGWTEDAFAAVEKITPLGHLASGDDIAGAAVYLAGALSVTAETIVVDSGMLAVGPRQ